MFNIFQILLYIPTKTKLSKVKQSIKLKENMRYIAVLRPVALFVLLSMGFIMHREYLGLCFAFPYLRQMIDNAQLPLTYAKMFF